MIDLTKITNKKFSIIYADLPWSYKNKANSSKNRGGAIAHYSTMNVDDICAMNVNDITKDDALLFMWCTWPMINEGMKVIESWGFEYKSLGFLWVKANKKYKDGDPFKPFMGLGNYTRSNSEFCLIGKKGKGLKRKSASVHQVIHTPIEGHSKKPDIARDKIIELCGRKRRIELFARQKTKGWTAWGNEV